MARYTWSRKREGRDAGKRFTLKKDGDIVATVAFADKEKTWYWALFGRKHAGPYNSLGAGVKFADAEAAKAAARKHVEDLGDQL